MVGNGGGGQSGNGYGGGMGRNRSSGSSGGGWAGASSWDDAQQYILRPQQPPSANAWAASSATVAATAASLADAERQEADRVARLRADAQAREEAVLALSTDALDAMRA